MKTLYYKWVGMFEKAGKGKVVTLKMNVRFKGFAERNAYRVIAREQARGWTLNGGHLMRTDKNYKTLK